MTLASLKTLALSVSAAALVAGCTPGQMDREAGAVILDNDFGESTRNNYLIHTGQLSHVVSLAQRFNREVPDTINFAFNSAVIDAQAARILDAQANFIRQFPEVTFRVYGHTDLVGSGAYNKQLGLRRAQAVVGYFSARGISRSRLEAVVSFGETQPLVQTQNPEERNRRTVTEVSGFVQDAPLVLNGKYAEVIFREYVNSAAPAPTVQGGLGELSAGAGGG